MSNIARLHSALKADLKAMHVLEDKSIASKWKGKIIAKSQGIVSSMRDTISAAWKTKSLRPSTFETERSLIQAAKTLETMKRAMVGIDKVNAKQNSKKLLDFARDAQRIANEFESRFENIKDADREGWIKSEKDSTISQFKTSLDRLIQSAQDELDAGILENLKDIPTFHSEPNATQAANVTKFKEELRAAFIDFQKNPPQVKEETLIQEAIDRSGTHLKMNLERINRTRDPVDKLNDLMDVCYHVGEQMNEHISGDLFLPTMMHLLASFPDASIPLIEDLMMYKEDDLKKLTNAKSRMKTISELDVKCKKIERQLNALSPAKKESPAGRALNAEFFRLTELRDRLQSTLYVNTVLKMALAAIHAKWTNQ